MLRAIRGVTLSILALFVPAARAEPPLALVGGTVVDVSNGGSSSADLRDAVVVLDRKAILAAGPRARTRIPPDARVVDVTGTYLVPGLVDAFAGMNSQAQANAYLYMGVTSVVVSDEPGGRRGALFATADPTPRLFPLAVLAGRRGEPESWIAVEQNEILADVEAQARRGGRVLLLYYGIAPADLRPIVLKARELGLGTIGELATSSYAEAMDAGVDAFVHTSRYSLDLAPQMREAVARAPFGPPRTRFYELLAGLDPGDAVVENYAHRLAASGVALIPTLSLYASELPGRDNPWREPIAQILDPKDIHLPVDRVTGRPPPAPGVPTGLSASVLRLEARYCRAGAKYVAGSGTSAFGTLPGIALHGELKELVGIGLSPRQALAAATANVGRTFRWPRVGVLEAGAFPDLVVVEEDPTRDVGNLKKIRMVVAAGRVVDRKALLKAR